MKSKIFNLLLLSCALFKISAQEFTTETSSSFAKNNNSELYQLVLANPYGFVTYHYKKFRVADMNREITITKYDQSMSSVNSINFSLPRLNKRIADLIEVFELPKANKLLFISKATDKKEGKHNVYVQIYDDEKNTISEPKLLNSIPIESYSRSGFNKVAISEDNSKIAVFTNLPYVKKTNESIKVMVYDTSTFNLIWKQEKTLDFPSKKAYSEKLFVNNNGTVYLNKLIDKFKKTRSIFNLTFNGDTVSKSKFSQDNFFPTEYKLLNSGNDSFFTGVYWNRKGNTVRFDDGAGYQNNGVFLYKISENQLLGKHNWEETIKYSQSNSIKIVKYFVENDNIFLVGEKQTYDSKFREVDGKSTMDIDEHYSYFSSVIANLDFSGTLKSFKLHSAEDMTYINSQKEEGGLGFLFLEGALHIFDNENKIYEYYDNQGHKYNLKNNEIRLTSYFNNSTPTLSVKKVQHKIISKVYVKPHMLSSSLKKVENYNLAYFISTYNNQYTFNKVSW